MTQGNQSDVIDLLLAQHGRIKGVLELVRISAGVEKQRRFDELVRLLAVHESVEAEVVHPAARRHSVGSEIVDSRMHEEYEAERMLARLYEMGVEHPEFDATFRCFADKIVAHAELEEKQEFGPLLIDTSVPERMWLAGVVRFAEALTPTYPDLGGTAVPSANLLAGPPTEIFARIRDTLRDWKRQSSSA